MGFPGLSCLLGIMEYGIGGKYLHNSAADFLGFVTPIKAIGTKTTTAGLNSTIMVISPPLYLCIFRPPIYGMDEVGIVGIEPTPL